VSNTDKTRPAWVKATDKAAYLVPVHDHRFGGCDLPERAEATRHGVYAPPKGARCHWGISAAFWASPAGRCGCGLCSGAAYLKAMSRQDRQTTKRQLRAYRDGGASTFR
jgi:hypothetical protein